VSLEIVNGGIMPEGLILKSDFVPTHEPTIGALTSLFLLLHDVISMNAMHAAINSNLILIRLAWS
jgi:hypothetical protein